MMLIGVFLVLDGKISMGALVAATMLAGRVLGPISGIAAVITRATQTLIALKAIDRVMGLERERPLDAPMCRAGSRRAPSPSRTSPSSIPTAPTTRSRRYRSKSRRASGSASSAGSDRARPPSAA